MQEEDKFLDYPEVGSLTLKAEKLVVMIHGLGSDGDDLITLVPYIQKSLPSCYFISPHGVEPYDMGPFGRQWFSLKDRSSSVVLKLAEGNAPLVSHIISRKQKEMNISNINTVLIGFSQGAMMATYLTLIQKRPYGATIAFSGRLLPPEKLINKLTPICLIHGKEDNIIDYREVIQATEYLKANGIKYEKLIIDNLGHSIDNKGLEFSLKFLKSLSVV